MTALFVLVEMSCMSNNGSEKRQVLSQRLGSSSACFCLDSDGTHPAPTRYNLNPGFQAVKRALRCFSQRTVILTRIDRVFDGTVSLLSQTRG